MPILEIFDRTGRLLPDAWPRLCGIIGLPVPDDRDSFASIKALAGRSGMAALRRGFLAGELLVATYAHYVSEQLPASLTRAVKFIAERRRGATNRFWSHRCQ
jgi:hypothetical protein